MPPLLRRILESARQARQARRWRQLKRAGLRVGDGTALPESLWIDTSCPYAIEIGCHVGFGPDVLILAHDAQMRAAMGATRVARVRVGDNCRIGARTLILPGVEIGDGAIVFAGSVVSRSLPADSVCGGSPARALGTVAQYLGNHHEQLEQSPSFAYAAYGKHGFTPQRVRDLQRALARGAIYIIGSEGVHAPRTLPDDAVAAVPPGSAAPRGIR